MSCSVVTSTSLEESTDCMVKTTAAFKISDPLYCLTTSWARLVEETLNNHPSVREETVWLDGPALSDMRETNGKK